MKLKNEWTIEDFVSQIPGIDEITNEWPKAGKRQYKRATKYNNSSTWDD